MFEYAHYGHDDVSGSVVTLVDVGTDKKYTILCFDANFVHSKKRGKGNTPNISIKYRKTFYQLAQLYKGEALCYTLIFKPHII